MVSYQRSSMEERQVHSLEVGGSNPPVGLGQTQGNSPRVNTTGRTRGKEQ